MAKMSISVCPYQSGEFDIFIKDANGKEVVFSGKKNLNYDEFEIVDRLAPSCVFTDYVSNQVKGE